MPGIHHLVLHVDSPYGVIASINNTEAPSHDQHHRRRSTDHRRALLGSALHLTTTEPIMTNQTIPLAEGERYIGGIVSADGTTTHIILLPGAFKGTWKKSMNWAAKQGGDLPSRIEQALLYATAKEEFERDYYWSNTDSESGWAWFQDCSYGYQGSNLKNNELRARAVRRLVI